MRLLTVFIVSLISLFIGAVGAITLGSSFFAGVGGSTGLAVGAQVGACAAVDAAQAEGLVPAESAERLLTATIGRLRDGPIGKGAAEPVRWVGTLADCRQVAGQAATP